MSLLFPFQSQWFLFTSNVRLFVTLYNNKPWSLTSIDDNRVWSYYYYILYLSLAIAAVVFSFMVYLICTLMYLISIWYSSVIDAMFDCCYTFNFSVKSISIVFGCVEVSHHIIPITPIINCLWFGCYYVIMHWWLLLNCANNY